MSNTRLDFYTEQTNSEEKKKCEAKIFCSLVRSNIFVHPSVHNGGAQQNRHVQLRQLIFDYYCNSKINETIKIIKVVSVDEKPAKIICKHSFMNAGRNPQLLHFY